MLGAGCGKGACECTREALDLTDKNAPTPSHNRG
jgi:hypothetical protein